MQEIDFDLLKLFCIVADTGKIYKAAESLYISQPAVTQQIKKLESELGGNLFYRTPKGVVLTEQGKSLYNFVKPSIEILENAPKKFSQYINLEEGKIRIKTGTTIGKVVLFEPLAQFIQDYPKIEIDMSSGLSTSAVEAVSNGKVDLALITLPAENDKDNVEIIEYKPLDQVLFSTKEYLEEKGIDIDNLDDVLTKGDLIFPTTESNTGKILYKYLREKGYDVKPTYSISSNSTREYIVKTGKGIAFGLKDNLSDSNLVISKLKFPISKVGIVVQKKDIASFATLKLLEYILE